MDIHFIPAFTDNYIYAVTADTACWIIDPGAAEPVLDWIQQDRCPPTAILCTHHHTDHVGGVAALAAQFKIPVYGANTRIPSLTHPLQEGKYAIDGVPVTIMELPGHTRDHLAYLVDQQLFCGDTLFAAGCGRLFEGTPAQMLHSLDRLAALPDATQVYCAHEYTLSNLRFARHLEPDHPILRERERRAERQRLTGRPTLPSTIGLERASNPFLRVRESSLIAAVQAHDLSVPNDPLSIFTALRSWKDQFQ
ncbi:hydroxyacylglutathione hydrolase [Acidithiobacillus sulfuriphilus]|uniref:Hydroxyacylglutathione hydrolase n=2 Tax=Acidithiobacillus sulfuriphilus TaxID=1867749 RepID=A0A3M8R6N0_9PROT|nr:hydroxyacylglutathione hydrolase [Acidithiobacillus sulfuriphilus]RNF62854.1 hydroxyacylglutathione hydrolase [Acidithiobacillus sulfuriphilus]